LAIPDFFPTTTPSVYGKNQRHERALGKDRGDTTDAEIVLRSLCLPSSLVALYLLYHNRLV
jgi:hypothetical protein